MFEARGRNTTTDIKEQELTTLVGSVDLEDNDDDGENLNEGTHQVVGINEHYVQRRYHRFGAVLGMLCALAALLGLPVMVGLLLQKNDEDAKTQQLKGTTVTASDTTPVKLFFDEYATTTTKIEIRGEDEVGERGYRLPTGIVRLTDLSLLNLDYDALGGQLPSELGALKQLTRLDLHGNKFGGIIPSEFFQLTKLRFLDLSHNRLEGVLPSRFFTSFPNLEVLDLSANSFSGSLPKQIGDLSQLTMLGLQINNFNGSLPTEMGSLDNLQTLWLQYNPLLSGTIPAPLCIHIPSPNKLLLSKTNITGCPAPP